MMLQLKTRLRCGHVDTGAFYAAGSVVDSEKLGLDEEQLAQLLEAGSAEFMADDEPENAVEMEQNGEPPETGKPLPVAGEAAPEPEAEVEPEVKPDGAPDA